MLENGVIRIGVDLNAGGAIGYLSNAKQNRNVVNTADLGRYIEQSYYSGPKPFGRPTPHWQNWSWNACSAGDFYYHSSRVLTHSNDGKTLYIKCIPMQWALNNVPSESTCETWITLKGNAAEVTHRLINSRADKTQYPHMSQECPALYTVGALDRLMTYDGPAPFTNAPLRRIENYVKPWAQWSATENWAALVNDADWGLGIFRPDVFTFIGGTRLTDGRRSYDPDHGSCSYIAPKTKEYMDHDITFVYRYYLILGNLRDIRKYVYNHRPDPRPDYRFEKDRQHWVYRNTLDTGFPGHKGFIRLRLEGNNPRMLGPEQWWDAETAPKLYITAAYRTTDTKASLYWKVPGKPPDAPDRKIDFRIRPDGQFHTYELDLASVPGYRGKIIGFHFNPVSHGRPGEYMDIKFMSWKNHAAEPPIKVTMRK
jgi:hypothetical protein